VEIVGYRSAALLSNGKVLQEQPGLARRRAEQVVELLKGAGLTAPKYNVRWVDASPVPNGTDDYRNRKVEITLQP
jgi:outer membrane protein OmpA-like peptidoglycan-associated protein